MEDGTQTFPGTTCDTPEALEIRRTFDRLGETWSFHVVHVLGSGPHRFAQLKREIGSISQRMLSRTLRSLERDGLVTRTVFPTNPPGVEYALTSTGESLEVAVRPLIEWTLAHQADIVRARARHDLMAAEDRQPVRQG